MKSKKNQTSFKEGNAGKQVGTKAKKTLFKEAVGLTSWEKMQEFILNRGIDKAIDEICTLKGNAYLVNYAQLLEYFKPKLSRTDSNINVTGELKNFIIELTDEANSNDGVEKI